MPSSAEPVQVFLTSWKNRPFKNIAIPAYTEIQSIDLAKAKKR
jgi:hypothetical protein